jgi:hypothetical protein
MMNWNDMGHGMGFGWIVVVIVCVVLVGLVIAALIKYLRK